MERSESIKELSAALAQAQQEIEGAAKDKNNPFFKSKYADLASVTEAVRGIGKYGLSYVQVIHDPLWSVVDDVVKFGFARAETFILHASGEWLSTGVVSIPINKGDAQTYTGGVTYARRTSLSAAFGVAPEDDDGNAATGKTVEPKVEQPARPAQKITHEQLTKFTDWCNERGLHPDYVLHAAKKYCQVDKLGDLTQEQALNVLVPHFKAKAKEQEARASEQDATSDPPDGENAQPATPQPPSGSNVAIALENEARRLNKHVALLRHIGTEYGASKVSELAEPHIAKVAEWLREQVKA